MPTVNVDALAYLYDHLKDFPSWFQRLTPGQMNQLAAILTGWRKSDDQPEGVQPLEEIEKRELTRALLVFDGDVCAAAKALGIGKTTAYRHLKKWGLSTSDSHVLHQASALSQPCRLQYLVRSIQDSGK